MNRSWTTVNRSSRERPRSTAFWSGATAAGFELATNNDITRGPSSSFSACPSRFMFTMRVRPGSRSGRTKERRSNA
jgi:hypothetical protein